MNMTAPWRRAAVLALATATLLSLSACAPALPASAPSTAAAPLSPTKKAGVFTKDIHVCFDNISATAVTIDWISDVSTNSGSGTLAAGQSFCGEGPAPIAGVTFSDSFATHVVTYNPAIGQPGVLFNSVALHQAQYCDGDACNTVMEANTFANAVYAEGETVGSDVEGHPFTVTRTADDDWINFTIAILD
jgi:hypothetical protein